MQLLLLLILGSRIPATTVGCIPSSASMLVYKRQSRRQIQVFVFVFHLVSKGKIPGTPKTLRPTDVVLRQHTFPGNISISPSIFIAFCFTYLLRGENFSGQMVIFDGVQKPADCAKYLPINMMNSIEVPYVAKVENIHMEKLIFLFGSVFFS